MSARDNRGIFCLESEWDSDLRDSKSVVPLLEVLEKLDIARTIHRHVATAADLTFYLRKWTQKKYDKYSVLYLATHGAVDAIELADKTLSLDGLGAILEGQCKDRIVYFGGCSTLSSSEDELKKYVRRLGAKAIVGYTSDVDWLESASFELLLLDEIVSAKQSAAMFRRLVTDHPRMATKLGLIVATGSSVYASDSIIEETP
jgi:hypothetical protein